MIGAALLGVPAAADWPTDPSIDAIVSDAAYQQRDYYTVADGQGGAYVVWKDTRLGVNSPRVYVQRISADGDMLWGDDGTPVGDGGGSQFTPHLARDTAGGLVVVWEDQRAGRDIYAQRFDMDGVKLWGETGLPVCIDGAYQYEPRILADPAGGAFVAWDDNRYHQGYENIFAQRLAADGMELWTPNGAIIFGGYGAERTVRLAPDGAGGCIYIASDLSNDVLRARRLTNTGADVWGGVVDFTTDAMNYPAFEIAPDGVGGVYVVWRSTWNDFMGQYLDAAGTKQWNGGNDLVISPVTPSTIDPVVTPDGAGGVYLGWTDTRLGGYDFYVQRMSPVGTRMWGDDAVHLSSILVNVGADLAADSNGNLLACWVLNDGDRSILAQKLTPAGAIEWTAGGELLSNSPGNTFDDPSVCLTDDDGLISVFERFPGTYADLHAKRSAADGTLGQSIGVEDVEEVAGGAAPISAWPNPFRTHMRIRLPEASGEITLFDVTGREIRSLRAIAGQIDWDGRDSGGREVAPGVYLVRQQGNAAAGPTRVVRLP